jgi:pyroglutamyl-peptidase
VTRVLVTGFEPFGGADVNPSQKLVEALSADRPEGLEVATAVLPVVWARAADELTRALEPLLPEQALEKAVPTMPLETLVRAARVILVSA